MPTTHAKVSKTRPPAGATLPPEPADDTPAGWRAWHQALVASFAAEHPLPEAEKRAWDVAQQAWHDRHGSVPGFGCCCGCGAPLVGRTMETLPDGATIHSDRPRCRSDWSFRWQRRAAMALVGQGLVPPRRPG
jgi:hypothetical protein